MTNITDHPSTRRLTAAQVAEQAQLTPRTIYRYHSQGYMPPADGHTSNHPWWHQHTITAWLSQRRNSPAAAEQTPMQVASPSGDRLELPRDC